ncbi:MAG TPA: adenine phosphoribosyltransferase [Verrucomicrobia bacterium]|nr:MAG: adenine phosphoribosyltransferase [Lentisphaerae bacterium GWF2_57_35]HBA84393.1 adenine phosphoribosyltransferase [Verrucomicrobiota bacterium]
MTAELLKAAIRDVADFPQPGVLFKDITPVIGNPKLFKTAIELLAERYKNSGIEKVAVVESRGFIFGSAVAFMLGAGLVPIRKKGKLPYKTIEADCTLEYGTATLQMHADAIKKGEKVLLLDDLLATGGTAAACVDMIEELGGNIVEIEFLIELAFLKGREKLAGYNVFAPIVF